MSLTHDTMRAEIEAGHYDLVTALDTIGALYARQQLTQEEYDELYELASALPAGREADADAIRWAQLEARLQRIEARLDELTEDKPSDADGSSPEAPIEAYAGMTYYKGRYYHDSSTGKTYLCTRDDDQQPGKGIALYYLPSQLVGHYFQEV